MARIVVERTEEDPLDAAAVRRLAQLFDEAGEAGQPECGPPVDVVEHANRVEVIVDLPGVPTSAVRVIFAAGTLIVAGRKRPRVCDHSIAFHLAERSFGRFVRAVGLSGAFDPGRASAALAAGELRIVLPRIEERRGRDIHIEVTAG